MYHSPPQIDPLKEFSIEVGKTINAARKLGVCSEECMDRDSVFRTVIRGSITKRPKELQTVLSEIASNLVAEFDSKLKATIIKK